MKSPSEAQTDGSGSHADPVPSLYFSPRDLAERWRCSRTGAQDIARREGFTKVFLGEGKRGMVRYLRSEVEAYEASRIVRAAE